jgi:hypothetical protein
MMSSKTCTQAVHEEITRPSAIRLARFELHVGIVHPGQKLQPVAAALDFAPAVLPSRNLIDLPNFQHPQNMKSMWTLDVAV